MFSNYGLSQVYSDIKPIVRINPVYPTELLEEKQEGWVKIKFDVSAQGNVENPVVVDANPVEVFDRSAIDALLKFKFKPKIIDGRAVPVEAIQIINFEIPGNQSFNSSVGFSTNNYSESTFELKSLKVKKNYQNTLIVSKAGTDTILKIVKLPISVKQIGHLAVNEKSPYVFYYHSTSNKSGKIQIYRKSDLKRVHDIKTDRLTYTKYQLKDHYLFEISPNPNNLLVFLGPSKKPSLYLLNGKTGKLSKKLTLEKNTLLKGNKNMNYLWARKVSALGGTSAGFNKRHKNKIKFINTESFEIYREINLTESLISAWSWGDVIQILFEYEKGSPRYRVMFMNLKENTMYDDFYSSKLPQIFSLGGVEKSLIMVGQSSGKNKHLKIGRFRNNKIMELSNKNIKIDYNEMSFKHDEKGFRMYVYGKNSFGVIDINDTNNFKIISIPMNIVDGFFNSQFTQAFLKEKSGSGVALVDIEKSKFIAYKKTGSPHKKFGQAFASIMTAALTAPSGYMVTPLGGFRQSEVKLFLNNAEDRIYALNKKTNDVTSFAAKDMTDKHIVDTGKGSFQIIQATHEPNLPVVVIGMSKVTFLNASDGRLIKQIEYDKPVEISDNHELTYIKDNQSKRISLAYIPK